jgi:hypothetical protein
MTPDGDDEVSEAPKKKRPRGSIMHVELTPRLRAKLEAIRTELKGDPRLDGTDVTRQTAWRHAVISYELKG